ncbi:hypothetical protein OUZ56_029509 [Daphnia magna]|uniref:Uncharacterized protein n=1 Tax=Daphnia magna TaxID=35525 RepID=A0ABR0B715_9CRUS|nr:hypothetical protein OUZ56_029509 [Daphnia magna]
MKFENTPMGPWVKFENRVRNTIPVIFIAIQAPYHYYFFNQSHVIEILTLRAKLHHGQLSSDSTICKYHEDYYLVDFKLHDGHGKNCCDPYKCHPSKIRKGSRTITLSQSRKLRNNSITKGQSEKPCLAHLSLVIDNKLCNLCYHEIKSIVNAVDVQDLDFSPLSEVTSPDSSPLSSQDMLVDVSA